MRSGRCNSGQGEVDGVHEVAVQFWSQPEDETISRLVERLEQDFGDDVRSVNLIA